MPLWKAADCNDSWPAIWSGLIGRAPTSKYTKVLEYLSSYESAQFPLSFLVSFQQSRSHARLLAQALLPDKEGRDKGKGLRQRLKPKHMHRRHLVAPTHDLCYGGIQFLDVVQTVSHMLFDLRSRIAAA